MDQDVEADDHVEGALGKNEPGGVGVEEGRRRHQLAGALDLHPVDLDTGHGVPIGTEMRCGQRGIVRDLGPYWL